MQDLSAVAFVGVGTDLVSVLRVRRLLDRFGDRFVHRILTHGERLVFERTPESRQASHLAKRFAAKEALSKALGVGIGEHVCFQEIHIQTDARGAPRLQVTGKTLAFARSLTPSGSKDPVFHLSLSDERDYAVAFILVSVPQR